MKLISFPPPDVRTVHDSGLTGFDRSRLPEIGTKVETSDGRGFKLVRAAASFARGPHLFVERLQSTVIAAPQTGAVLGQATTVVINSVLATQNQFAGGFLEITTGSGLGLYAIRGNSSDDGTGSITVDLNESIYEAISAGWTGRVSYKEGTLHTIGTIVEGVTLTDIPVTTGAKYFWIQFAGPALLELDEVPPEGLSSVEWTGTHQGGISSLVFDGIVGTLLSEGSAIPGPVKTLLNLV